MISLRGTALSSVAVIVTVAACTHDEKPPRRDPGYVPTPPAALDSDPQTPRRLRRLTNREMNNVLDDLLGAPVNFTRGFLRDPGVEGYDNDAVALGVSESKAEEVAAVAERAGVYLSAPERLEQFAPCRGADLPTCARSFATTLATRAWGRAPAAAELDRLTDVFKVALDGSDYAGGIALVAETVLQSPYFVYRSELGEAIQGGLFRLTAPEIASAMSFTLIGARPDAALLEAASAGELFTPDGRERQARRLQQTPAARRQLEVFVRAWLRLTDVAAINKDLGIYPGFTPKVRFAMDRELDTFLDHVLDGSGRLDELLLADYSFPSPDLLPIYQDDVLDPPGDFTRVRLDTRRRRGVLSSPAFLATHGRIDQTNPVERGLMIRSAVLCQEVVPPPSGVPPAPAGKPGLTTRARYAEHSNNPACSSCHQLMDPIGFGFEAFDTLGRYRTEDNGQPVDASGELLGTDIDGPFTGPAELSERLPRSALFRRCFVKQLWRFAEGRSAGAADARELDGLAWRFEQVDHGIADQMVELVRRPTFVLRKASEVGP
jgi:hypothetical protein